MAKSKKDKKDNHSIHKHIHNQSKIQYASLVLIIIAAILLFNNQLGDRAVTAEDIQKLDPTLTTEQAQDLAGEAFRLRASKKIMNNVNALNQLKVSAAITTAQANTLGVSKPTTTIGPSTGRVDADTNTGATLIKNSVKKTDEQMNAEGWTKLPNGEWFRLDGKWNQWDYDGDGNVDFQYWYDVNTGWYYYDTNGDGNIDYSKRKTADGWTEYDNDNDGTVDSRIRIENGNKITEIYDINGKLEYRIIVSINGIQTTEIYENGKLVYRTITNPNGLPIVEYFDSNGNLIRRDTTNLDGSVNIDFGADGTIDQVLPPPRYS